MREYIFRESFLSCFPFPPRVTKRSRNLCVYPLSSSAPLRSRLIFGPLKSSKKISFLFVCLKIAKIAKIAKSRARGNEGGKGINQRKESKKDVGSMRRHEIIFFGLTTSLSYTLSLSALFEHNKFKSICF